MAILFRPFDLGKWFVIGFSAFLAGLLTGGNGFNFSGNFSPQRQQQQFHQQFQHMTSAMAALQAGTVTLLVGVVLIFVFGLIALMYWLGARGQFLFLDNIARNRGEIAGPWKFYARPANEVFLFQVIYLALGIGLMVVLAVPAVLLLLPAFRHQTPGVPAIVALIVLGLAYLVACLALGIFLFIFREWGIALMFRNQLPLRAALLEIWALIRARPGSIALFVLLRFALWIALVVLAVLSCCVFCCLALLPYTGTVILLPALIFIRCFSLECLAQFGPAYDVWTVDLPPAGFAPATPLPPPG